MTVDVSIGFFKLQSYYFKSHLNVIHWRPTQLGHEVNRKIHALLVKEKKS